MPPSGQAPLTSTQYKKKYGVALPKKRSEGGRTRKRDDPVLEYLHSATSFVKDVGGWFKDDAVDTVKKAKRVYKTVDKYGDARQEALLHPRRYQTKHPTEQQALAVSTPMKEVMAQAGRFFIRPGKEPFSLEDIVDRLPKHYGTGNPFSRAKVMHLPEDPTYFPPRSTEWMGDPGVGGRIPWLVNTKRGEIPVGKLGESHGAVARKLGNRIGDANVNRRLAEGGGARSQDWMEGWIGKSHLRGEDPVYSVTTATRGLMGTAHPEDMRGIKTLIDYLTETVTDKSIFLRPGAWKSATERQGSRANDLLSKLGGPMNEKQMAEHWYASSKALPYRRHRIQVSSSEKVHLFQEYLADLIIKGTKR